MARPIARIAAQAAAAKVERRRERKRVWMQAWHAANRERSRELKLESYARHREAILARRRARYAADPEPKKAWQRARRQQE